MTRLVAGSATDVGRVRSNNQDSLLVALPLFAVADGMGGHAAGEVASETALDGLRQSFEAGGPPTAELLAAAVKAANRAVWDAAEANVDYRGMGTTLTAVALVRIDEREELAVANVGDSRTYRLRDGELEQMTADHSLVAELVAEGQITETEAETHPQRHVLTRALGVTPDVEVDLLTIDPYRGDRYLLCSDGLVREVSDGRVASVLRRLADPEEAARELVAEARANGGSDNITVVVVDVVDDDEAARTTDALAAEPGLVIPQDLAIDEADGERATDVTSQHAVAVAPVSRRERRRAARADQPPRARAVTGRVVVFAVLLVVVVAVAVGGTAWYARDSYFVGVDGSRLVIYQGRPGGVLWWKPTVAEHQAAPTSTVESYHLAALQAGVQETSLTAARAYIGRLQAEATSATSTTTTPSTAPATTTTPTTAPPTTVATAPRSPSSTAKGRG